MKKFQYGSIVNFFCNKNHHLTNFTGPAMGVSIVDGNEGDIVPCLIEKYWEDDVDAMSAHKIKLVPTIAGYAERTLYVSDFKDSLRRNEQYTISTD